MGDIIKSLNGGDGNGPLICFATSSFDNFSSITSGYWRADTKFFVCWLGSMPSNGIVKPFLKPFKRN